MENEKHYSTIILCIKLDTFSVTDTKSDLQHLKIVVNSNFRSQHSYSDNLRDILPFVLISARHPGSQIFKTFTHLTREMFKVLCVTSRCYFMYAPHVHPAVKTPPSHCRLENQLCTFQKDFKIPINIKFGKGYCNRFEHLVIFKHSLCFMFSRKLQSRRSRSMSLSQ